MEIRENTLRYKIRKKLPPLLIAALVIYLIWHAFGSMLPGLIPLLREGDEQKIAAFLAEQQGTKGIISVMLLSGIQVVSVVLPGMAIQIAAGLIYGWWKAFLLCYTGFVIANALVFAFARRMGSSGTDNITISGTGRRFLEKLRNTPPPFMVCILNLVPAVPNGIIPYLAAKMEISFAEYVAAVMTGSFVQILMGCLAGSFIMKGRWLYMVLIFVVQVILIAIVLWQKDFIIVRVQNRLSRLKEKLGKAHGKAKEKISGAVKRTGVYVEAGPVKAAAPGTETDPDKNVRFRLDGLRNGLESITEGIKKGIAESGSSSDKEE